MDPEKLFETMTVEEVKRMLQDTRVNIERKKEELRFLVGERYRDIIEAADTISEMKNSAEEINNSIVRLNQECSEWHREIYLSNHAPVNQPTEREGGGYNAKYAVAAQVKALLDMPELLWSAVERQEHSKAAVLFLTSRHVFTHLQLGGEMRPARVDALPLVSRQWNALVQFREVVVRGARNCLRRGYTPEEQICDSLGSLVLLNDLSLEQVFEEYLSARKSAVEMCVSSDNTSSTARSQIAAGLELLLSSIRQINDLFVPDSNEEELDENLQPTGVSFLQKTLADSVSISLHDHSEMNDRIFGFLPKTVADFRPSLSHMKEALDTDFLRRATSRWFHRCMEIFGPSVRGLLSHINSVKALNDIRDTISSSLAEMTVKDSAWRDSAARVLDCEVDLWRDCLKAIFIERLECVMKSSFLDIFDRLYEEAQSIVNAKSESSDDHHVGQLDSFDLNAWLWAEQTKDVSVEEVWNAGSRHGLSGGPRALNPLGRKFACLTPAVQKLANAFNERLCFVREDLMLAEVEEEEKAEVQALMTASLQTSVEKLLVWVEDQRAQAESLSSNNACRARLLFYSRLCLALVEMCPSLRLSLDPTSQRPATASGTFRSSVSASKHVSAAWQDTCTKLVATANQVTVTWLRRAFKGIAKRFAESLVSYHDPLSFLELCPKWDEVQLEGANVRVPCQASWHVHRLLSSVCQEFNASGAHVISMSVLSECLKELSDELIASLRLVIKDRSDSLTQPQALQLLFDARFLFIMLPVGDTATLERTFADLEAIIDPFDLDVASTPMQTHISQLRARCSLIYGLVFGLHDRLGAIAVTGWGGNNAVVNSAGGAGQSPDEHHLLAKCGGQGFRFALLPSSGTLRPQATDDPLKPTATRGKKAGSRKSYTFF